MKYRIMQEWELEYTNLKVNYDSAEPESIYILDTEDNDNVVIDLTINCASELAAALVQAVNAAAKINPAKKETPRR